MIFATGNAHKVEEAQYIFRRTDFRFQSLKEIGFTDDIIEDKDTLEGNALVKARHIYQIYKKNVFAEDTGLEIHALNMDPGVYTARYAGPQKNHDDNMSKVLKNLTNHSDRRARFRAVIALIFNDKEYLFEGIVNGIIGEEKYGQGGFGYDPIFIPEGYDQTFAELGNKIKSKLSHRAKALTKMKRHLERLDIEI